MAWGGELFSSDIMWWLDDWIRLILHQLPLPRKRGKDILVSTSWWEVANHIRYGGHVFPFSIPDPQGIGEMPSSPDPRSPVFFEILCGLLLSSWPKASDEADGNTGRPQPGFFRITGKKIFELTSDGLGGELFSSDIMWWLGDWIRLILHQLPLPRKSLKRGKIILVSTSWWEVANHIRYGIRYRNDRPIGQDP